jgi:hypothetical protein
MEILAIQCPHVNNPLMFSTNEIVVCDKLKPNKKYHIPIWTSLPNDYEIVYSFIHTTKIKKTFGIDVQTREECNQTKTKITKMKIAMTTTNQPKTILQPKQVEPVPRELNNNQEIIPKWIKYTGTIGLIITSFVTTTVIFKACVKMRMRQEETKLFTTLSRKYKSPPLPRPPSLTSDFNQREPIILPLYRLEECECFHEIEECEHSYGCNYHETIV